VVQGALKLILEPSSRRTSNRGRLDTVPSGQLTKRWTVWLAIVQQKTRVIDIDLRSYFDNVRHDRLFAKVAERVDDVDVTHPVPDRRNRRGPCPHPSEFPASSCLMQLAVA
jgi:RNA-directed DNA polymerase